MTKLTLVFGLLVLSLTSYGQTTADSTNKLLTSKYAGTYSYGTDIEKERVGTIFIYPETDSTVLFFIDLNRGAPTYNMGSKYGRLKITNDTATFYQMFEDTGCKLAFKFSKNTITIKTVDGQDDCEFGHAVFADGEFKQVNDRTLEYFENGEGTKVYIKTTTPEDYYK